MSAATGRRGSARARSEPAESRAFRYSLVAVPHFGSERETAPRGDGEMSGSGEDGDDSSGRPAGPPSREPVERELKLGIPDESSFRRLIRAVGGDRAQPRLQRNHFFDSGDGRLRAARLGLRLRSEQRPGGVQERWWASLKGPADGAAGHAFSRRRELEAPCPATWAREVLARTREPESLLARLAEAFGAETPLLAQARRELDGAPLQLLGYFENHRTEVRTTLPGASPCMAVLEFDHTDFAGLEERFEVEVEVASDPEAVAVRAALLALFERCGVAPEPSTSKLSRFVELLDRGR